jgi:hypothetical protein
MNHLLRSRLRQSFYETSRSVPQVGSQFRGLVTPIHEISELAWREPQKPTTDVIGTLVRFML